MSLLTNIPTEKALQVIKPLLSTDLFEAEDLCDLDILLLEWGIIIS